jgi:urease accessory protein
MDDAALLAMLQLADSAFPTGAYTLSGGLETLVEEGIVNDRSGIAGCVRSMLLGRAARGDLAALVAAHRSASLAPPDLDAILEIDRRLEATKLAAEERLGSCRVGRRLATEAARLIDAPIVGFGVASAALAIPERQAALAAAHGQVLGLLATAVRLGQIGHGDQQRLLRDARETIAEAVEIAQASDGRTFRPFAPGLDIAMGRHEVAAGRLFAS